eukprot:4966750-Pyramimonas_sp.AAC.1
MCIRDRPSRAQDIVPQGRLVGVRVELPGLGVVGILSVYMQVSVGLTETNLGILAAAAVLQNGYHIPILITGDYNMNPNKLRHHDYVQRA